MKLDNYEFENTYKEILRAEDDVVVMQKKKGISTEKEISAAINLELKTKQELNEKNIKRQKDQAEFNEKIDNAMKDLQYVSKSKNLVTKNIKCADDRISTLKESLEVLQTQKYLLTKNKNEIIHEMKDYEEKIRNVDSNFKKFIEDIEKDQDDEEIEVDQLRKSRANIQTDAINEVRRKIQNGELVLTSSPTTFVPEERKVKRVIDKEEDKRRVEKLNKLSVSDCLVYKYTERSRRYSY